MKVVTAEVMRALDLRAIEGAGIPGAVLMENAGRAVFDYLVERFAPLSDRPFAVMCGTGSNGGDGFVVARYLHLAGARVAVRICGDPGRIEGNAQTHFAVLESIGIRPVSGNPESSIKVDALLGTGAKGAPRGEYAEAIRWMNADKQPIIAVDIPSGVDADTGGTPGGAVRATATITFGYPKLGLLVGNGVEFTGNLVVRDIGFAWETLAVDSPYRMLQLQDAKAMFPRRARDSHKGMFGHVLIVGGSIGMSGAPAMAAEAALRAGAGLVTVAAPKSAQPLVAAHRREVMTRSVSELNGALAVDAIGDISSAAELCDVLCVGPGLSRETEALKLVSAIIKAIDKPIVLDADGLGAAPKSTESIAGRRQSTVLTPHPGECARLLETDAKSIQADRLSAVQEAARRYRSVVVLKGAQTLIADGRNDSAASPITINTNGNPGMATAGSGDSLTGIIGALIGQGLDAYDAAGLGVYLHGRAGDLAAARKGLAAMIAGDIIEELSCAVGELEGYE